MQNVINESNCLQIYETISLEGTKFGNVAVGVKAKEGGHKGEC